MEKRIERVDNIPLIVHWLKKMGVQETIDNIYVPHGNWEGISYGQLAVLFLTYVLHSLNHRLSGMEPWFKKHKTLLEEITGWELSDKDATDDRLGIMCGAFGECDSKSIEFQENQGRRLIHAYELPTEIFRYDTTSFNVYHDLDKADGGLLFFGHSKDKRPDLLQFKQGLGTLDPAGVPIVTETIAGNKADDRCYVPAWRQMVRTVGHSDFLYIADCKAASLESRATIDKNEGYYLFPMPMTGETPEILKELVLNPPKEPQEISLDMALHEKPKIVGKGFEIEKHIEAKLEGENNHEWAERWFITCSNAHADRQTKGFEARLTKAEKQLGNLKPRKGESVAEFSSRAQQVLKKYKVDGCVNIEVKVTISQEKKYVGKGRPGPNRPFKMVEIRTLKLVYQRNEEAIEEQMALFGWRIFVTNTGSDKMTLSQSTLYYRNEWLVERGFHRFKKGSIPALPMFLRIAERIKGLMLLLTVALQAITLLEFTARKELEKNNEKIAGLVPGNPKMKTDRPTAERLLSQFDNLHLLIEGSEKQESGCILEKLTPLQKRILALLKIPESIYELTFNRIKLVNCS